MQEADIQKRRLILRGMLNALDDSDEDDYGAGYSSLVELEQEVGDFDDFPALTAGETALASEVALFLTDQPGGGPHVQTPAHNGAATGPAAGATGTPRRWDGPEHQGDG